MKVLKVVLLVLVGIGVLRGVVRWQESTEGNPLVRLVESFVGAVADITYKWLPELIEFLQRGIESAGMVTGTW